MQEALLHKDVVVCTEMDIRSRIPSSRRILHNFHIFKHADVVTAEAPFSEFLAKVSNKNFLLSASQWYRMTSVE